MITEPLQKKISRYCNKELLNRHSYPTVAIKVYMIKSVIWSIDGLISSTLPGFIRSTTIYMTLN